MLGVLIFSGVLVLLSIRCSRNTLLQCFVAGNLKSAVFLHTNYTPVRSTIQVNESEIPLVEVAIKAVQGGRMSTTRYTIFYVVRALFQ